MGTLLLLTLRVFPFQHAGSLFTYLELVLLPPKMKACNFDPFPASFWAFSFLRMLWAQPLLGWGQGQKEEKRRTQFSSEPLVVGVGLANQ